MIRLPFDLETAPTARALALPYPRAEREAPKNYSKPEAIEGWYVRDEADWKAGLAKTAALNPRLGRIVAVGVGDFVAVGTNEQDEREIVTLALDALADTALVTTFNGLSFDFPYLHARAAILGVRIPYAPSEMLRRYVINRHADLYAVLSNWSYGEKGDTLHGWCEAFGIEVTDTSTGADIGSAVEIGDEAFIKAHLTSDLSLTAQLAARMDAAGML